MAAQTRETQLPAITEENIEKIVDALLQARSLGTQSEVYHKTGGLLSFASSAMSYHRYPVCSKAPLKTQTDLVYSTVLHVEQFIWETKINSRQLLAVRELYFDVNPHVKDAAQRWLFMAQRSPLAWQFSWGLLMPNKPVEVQYFGASALYTKISRFWPELQPDQYDSLRTQLFQQIFIFSSGAKIVLTRLCVALSSFCLHTMPEVWPDAVSGVIDTFQGASLANIDATQKCMALLEFLTVLPEEFLTVPLPQVRRSSVRAELQAGLKKVLPLLESLLKQEDSPTQVRLQAIKCVSSWVKLDIPLNDLDQITGTLFQLMRDQDLFDLCIDALSDIITQPTSPKFPLSVQKFMDQVLLQQEKINYAIEQRDMDVVEGYCRLVVTLGENHTTLLIAEAENNHLDRILKYMQMAVGFSMIPGHYPVDETISNMSMGFWYLLQDEILARTPQENLVKKVQVFIPFYYQLIEALLIKAQFPAEAEYVTWNAEEKEQFRCFRQDIGDTFMNCFSLLNDPLLSHLYAVLVGFMQGHETKWQQVEACLFAFQSIAEGGNVIGSSQAVRDLFKLLEQLDMSQTHQLAATSLYMLGAYSEYLYYNTDALQSVIPLLVKAMHEPKLVDAASLAIKDIATECLLEIQPFSETILDACQAVLTCNTIKSRDSIRIMSVVGLVLSTLKLDLIMKYLDTILKPQIVELENAANLQPSPSTKAVIMTKLSMLSNLCFALDVRRDVRPAEDFDNEDDEETTTKVRLPAADGPQPIMLFLPQILPILEKLLQVWLSDAGVVESVCSVLQRASRTLMDDMKPLIPSLCQLICQIYSALPQSSVLELSQQILILFGGEEDIRTSVGGLFSHLCNKTASLMSAGSQDETDVVHAFLSLCSVLVKKHPKLYIHDGVSLSAIMQCGLMGITFPEPPTVKAACQFFANFIANNEKEPAFQQCIRDHGKAVLEIALKGISGGVARSLVENMADILFAMNVHCFSLLSCWITDLMLSPSLELPLATKEQRERFGQSILRNRVNKRQMKEIVKEFSLICRGLHGIGYAE